jgi:hypothetical protein
LCSLAKCIAAISLLLRNQGFRSVRGCVLRRFCGQQRLVGSMLQEW